MNQAFEASPSKLKPQVGDIVSRVGAEIGAGPQAEMPGYFELRNRVGVPCRQQVQDLVARIAELDRLSMPLHRALLRVHRKAVQQPHDHPFARGVRMPPVPRWRSVC